MGGLDFMTIAHWLGHSDGGILVGKVYGHLADARGARMADGLSIWHNCEGVPKCGRELRRAPKLTGGGSCLYGSIELFEKNFRNSGRFGICLARMRPRCSGRRPVRSTNWNSPKALTPNLATGQAPVWTANSRRRGKILGEPSMFLPILTTIAQMTDAETVMNLLRQVPLFINLKDEDKICIEETEEWRLSEGELVVKAGEPAEHFFVLLEGEISVSKKDGDQEIVVARYTSGAFFDEVPLLLGVPYILTARAESVSRLIVFAEEGFWRLLRLCPAISSEIFRAMATRLRNLEGSAQQQQKLEALGTMSAGLAHELNNPSAAAQRIAAHLGEVIQAIQSVTHRLHHTLEHEHWDRLIALVGEVLKNPSAGKRPHSMEQSDSEDALAAWLREGGVTDAWKSLPCSSARDWI